MFDRALNMPLSITVMLNTIDMLYSGNEWVNMYARELSSAISPPETIDKLIHNPIHL